MTGRGRSVVWVESPLQFLTAADYAATRGIRPRVAFRLGPQMSATAAELLRRGAPFASCEPYLGIPWTELRNADRWILGDGLSGQAHLALAVLRPAEVVFVDDGWTSLRLADALAGAEPFERPGRPSTVARALLAARAGRHLAGLASRGGLEFSSVFASVRPEFARAAHRGVRLAESRLDWVRASGRPVPLPARRVLLGTAGVTDGIESIGAHRASVAAHAASGDVVYLPHRRATADLRAAVAAVPGVHVLDLGIPVELALAGSRGLEILPSPSTAAVTLARVVAAAPAREESR